MIELSGNELGWILRLAELHNDSKDFKNYLKKFELEDLQKFLNLLIVKFHPSNFNCGNSKIKWILITKEELEDIKNESCKVKG